MNAVAGGRWASAARGSIVLIPTFAFGAIVSTTFMSSFADSGNHDLAAGVASGLIAFGGLLVGFLVTLMLFTGKIENATSLSLEQAQAYSQRIKLLLASQTATLFSAILMTLLAIAWLVFLAQKGDALQIIIIGMVLFGFVSVAVSRALLLPFQIFELHEASLDGLVDAASDSAVRKYRS